MVGVGVGEGDGMGGLSELEPSLGALPSPGGVTFRVWAPASKGAELLLEDPERVLSMQREPGGYFAATVHRLAAGARYRYRLDGASIFPDPASRHQPEGAHGPSQVVDPTKYRWRSTRSASANWNEAIIYELHLGTFSPQGGFEGACRKLPYLAELGVNTIELMPVAQCPGRWNWGYDPASFFAPSNAYGTPDELRCLVDEAHRLGLSVIHDVVYNHFGPDGAYLPAFSPYTLTSRHHTPWGQALDFDGPHSHGVRRFCLENALMWLKEYQFDGLRLDATFAIVDEGPSHLLAELSAAVAELEGPPRLLIAEDPRNLRNMVLPLEQGGFGLGAVWADDFHHQLRVRFAGDDRGYFKDFSGSSAQIARTLCGNWFYSGHHSKHDGGPRGTGAGDLPVCRFVYCIQNHDQIGNQPDGARLHHQIPVAAYRAASALLLFAPQIPMLFMGQEWAAGSPFLFFTDHQGELAEAVSEGRRKEFEDFDFGDEVLDPQDPEAFRRSVLDWDELEGEHHAAILRMYRDLLALRRSLSGKAEVQEVQAAGLSLRRGNHLMLIAFEGDAQLSVPSGVKAIWSSEDRSYAADPLPPVVDTATVSFGRAAALLLELDE
ncbi:MAG: malto-oligosyltrehalose trehalohydrolase [Trueperaceae bacterium]